MSEQAAGPGGDSPAEEGDVRWRNGRLERFDGQEWRPPKLIPETGGYGLLREVPPSARPPGAALPAPEPPEAEPGS